MQNYGDFVAAQTFLLPFLLLLSWVLENPKGPPISYFTIIKIKIKISAIYAFLVSFHNIKILFSNT